MVNYIKGNLLNAKADALVNTVNTVGVMGKGVALAFKQAFSHNFQVYKKACDDGKLVIGELLIVADENLFLGKRTIVNFPTKTHWRLPSQYEYVEKGLQALQIYLSQNSSLTLAMPAPGCGNGGLEWAKVKQMIDQHLSHLPNDITVYEPL